MLEKGVAVMGMQETNVCWHEVHNTNKNWDQFRGWREIRGQQLTVAYNSSDKLSKNSQYGGTSLNNLNTLTNRYLESGVGETKLVRWAWKRYRGSEGKVFQVVSVYKPCELWRFNLAYLQQLIYFLKK